MKLDQRPSSQSKPPGVSALGPWTIHEYEVVSSTNLVCAALPPWHAVRADSQTAGRGRFQRTWVSDTGGLWLSAVVPAPLDAPWTRLLPLVAGLAVCEVLQELGVTSLRMRWPNDLLVGNRKLAGLLIDQFVPGRAVIGIGINLQNRPEESAPDLRGFVTRLDDLLPRAPQMRVLTNLVLAALEKVCAESQTPETGGFVTRLNTLWHLPRTVRLEADDQEFTGQFDGVDGAGRLKLFLPEGTCKLFEPHQVRCLRDV